jgi:2-(1,2-epoxy-1,2-dihydrophenyl)acetyl-CoA isomerase
METIDTGPLLVTESEGIVTITINRPEKRNAINGAALRSLTTAVTAVAVDPSVRVCVLQGAGGYFSSGVDLRDPETAIAGLDIMRRLGDLVVRLHHLPVPTIASVAGGAYGYACNLALACDVTLASADAMFCEVFTARGLSVDGGGTWLLPRLVGLKQAKRLAYLADPLAASEAEGLGLITASVPPEALAAETAGWAVRLAGIPRTAFSLTKAMLNDAFEVSLEQAVAQEARSQVLSATSPETVAMRAAPASRAVSGGQST